MLIALAIDEWRESVAEAESENEYLHQLVADLQSTEEQIAEVAELNAIGETAA